MKKQFLSSIPEVFEEMNNGTQATKRSWLGLGKSVESYWYILVVFFGMLLLYAMARIISLQRRVRDLEARPPVDDITLRGAVRLQLNDLVSDLEQTLRAKQTDAPASTLSFPSFAPSSAAPAPFPAPFPAPAPAPALSSSQYITHAHVKKQDVLDEELNQVLEIANSVKASLPDVKLFANAMKIQKQKSKEIEIEKERERERENVEKEVEDVKKNEVKNEDIKLEVLEVLEKDNEPTVEISIRKQEQVQVQVKEQVKEQEQEQVKELEVEHVQEQEGEQDQSVPRWSTPVSKKEKKLKIANSANFKRGAGRRKVEDTHTNEGR